MFTEKIRVYLKRLLGVLKYAGSCENAVCHKAGKRQKSCDAVVVIAAHRRTEILVQVVNNLLSFHDTALETSLSVVVCVSSVDDAELLDSGVGDNKSLHIIRCANLPLGNKWQQAVEYSKLLSPQALIICGSDDLLSYSYLSACLGNINHSDEWALCAPAQWHMVDANSQVFAVRYKASGATRILGSGRVYSREFMKQINWKLFDRYLDSGLDYRGLSMVHNRGEDKLHIISMQFTVMSVKGNWAMLNTLDDIRMSDGLLTERLSTENSARCMQAFGLQ
jgi:hypothetical protein